MLINYKQIAVQIETQDGTVEGSEAAGDLITVRNPSWAPDFQRHERETTAKSLSPTQTVNGTQKVTLTFEVELAGNVSGVLTDAPPIDSILRACGWRSFGDGSGPYGGAGEIGKVYVITMPATWVSGTQLDHDTLITGTTSAATGRIIGTYFVGDTKAVVRVVTGSFTGAGENFTASGIDIAATSFDEGSRAYHPGDKPAYLLTGTAEGTPVEGMVLTDSVTGAKGMVIEVIAATDLLVERIPGFGFFATGGNAQNASDGLSSLTTVQQHDVPSLSITYYEDGNRLRFRGSRGTGVATMDVGGMGIVAVSMEATLDAQGGAALFPEVLGPEAIPPIFMGGELIVDNDWHPLISQLTVDFARTVSMRPDAESATGFRHAMITARRMTATMDAEAVQEDAYAAILKARNATSIRLRTNWGTAGTGNAWLINLPNMTFSLTPGDREGVETYDLAMELFPKAAIRGDEMVLVNY